MESTTQYNNYIENTVKMHEDKIAKEKQLIGQSTYVLNKSGSKWLTVGLSPAAGFVPIVQIRSTATRSVFFTLDEWEEFMKTEGHSPNHQIHYSSYKDIDVISLTSRGRKLVLSKQTYNNLYYLCELINQKLSIFKSCNFVKFYENVLKSCLTLDGDLHSNIKELMSSFQSSENCFYLLEALYVAFPIIQFDFEVMKIHL